MGSESGLGSPSLTRGFCRATVATVLLLGCPKSIVAAGPETTLTTGTQPELLAEVSRRRPGEDETPDETKTRYPRGSTDGGRLRPGTKPTPPSAQEELPDPNRATGLKRIPPPPPTAPGDFIPVPDRWRLAKDLSLVKEPWYDPYNRNLLKADRPFYRDWFFNASVISDSIVELRQLPTPAASQSRARPPGHLWRTRPTFF